MKECDDDWKEEAIRNYKLALRQLEEFVLLDDLIRRQQEEERKDDDDEKEASLKVNEETPTKTEKEEKENPTYVYYKKWRELRRQLFDDESSRELNEYINEADCFFPDTLSMTTTTTTTKTTTTNQHNSIITDSSQMATIPPQTQTQTRPTSILCTTEEMITVTVKSEEKKQQVVSELTNVTPTATTTVTQSSGYLGEPAEFTKCIEKLISSTQIVDKHLDNIQKPNKEFCEFEKQEVKLNAIKQTLESLAVALKTSLLHKQSIMDRSDKETSKRIGKLISQLTKQHQNVVDKYREKKSAYLKNYDKWSVFNKDVETISEWLEIALKKVNDLQSQFLESDKVKEIIKDFSNLTSKRLLLERTNLNGQEILAKSNEHESKQLAEKLVNLNDTWKQLISLLNHIKEEYANKHSQQQSEQKQQQQRQTRTMSGEDEPYQIFTKKLGDNQEWIEKCNELLSKPEFLADELEINRILFEVKELENELPYRRSIFENDFRNYSAKLRTTSTSNELVELVEKNSQEILKRYYQLNEEFATKREQLEKNLDELKVLEDDLNKMLNWIDNVGLDFIKLVAPQVIATPTSDSSDSTKATTPISPSSSSFNLLDQKPLRAEINSKHGEFEELKARFARVQETTSSQSEETTMPKFFMQKMEDLIKKWAELDLMATTSTTSQDQTITERSRSIATTTLVTRPSELSDTNRNLVKSSEIYQKNKPEMEEDQQKQQQQEVEETTTADILTSDMADRKSPPMTPTTPTPIEEKANGDEEEEEEHEYEPEPEPEQETPEPEKDVQKDQRQIELENIEKESIEEDKKSETTSLKQPQPPQQTNGFKTKTTSMESLKATTIVTPIDLERTTKEEATAINIMKLDEKPVEAKIVNVNEEEAAAVETNGDGETQTRRSSKVFTFTSAEEADKLDTATTTPSDLEQAASDLFDWLLWIDHTLETQLVVVGDLEQCEQLVKKYNSVLNEMKKKQERLDKLMEITAEKGQQMNGHKSEEICNINDRLKLLELQWNERLDKVNDRKQHLETMLTDCTNLNGSYEEFLAKISAMEEKVERLPDLAVGKETLKRQKTDYKILRSELNQLRPFFDNINETNKSILDSYASDDTNAHRVKFERLAARFQDLENKLSSHGEGISDALQTIDDFNGQLANFSQWLYKIEQDLNYLEDYCIRSDDGNSTKQTVIELYQELQKEIDNQNGAFSNLSETSTLVLESMSKNKEEKASLKAQLDEINTRWCALRKKSLEIRSRLESNSAQWSALLSSLRELIQWCKNQQKEIVIRKRSLQPDLNLVCKQMNENKIFMCNVEYKKSIIESTLASAKLYYDDRIKNIDLTTPKTAAAEKSEPQTEAEPETNKSFSIFGLKRRKSSSSKSSSSKKDKKLLQELKIKEDGETNGGEIELNGDSHHFTDHMEDENEAQTDENELEQVLANTTLTSDEKSAILVGKIERNVHTLDRLWGELNRQSLNYNNTLINVFNNLQLLQKAFEVVQAKLNENEAVLGKINVVNQIESDKLADELEKVKQFQLKVSSYQPYVDSMCTHYTNVMQELQTCESSYLQALNDSAAVADDEEVKMVLKQPNITSKFDDLNLRWSNLQNKLQENYLHLYSLIESSGADIFIKLADSVQPPWQRAVSANNKIPYYINHATEITSWDHPKMIDLYKSFANLNDIRFSAYRTAMKLRTLQKRLWLDLVEISDAIEVFDKHGLKGQNDRNLDTTQIIQILNRLFQPAVKHNSEIIDLVLAVDLTLNWLLCVYDPSRCGQIRALSLKTAIILLCKGSIEDKYIYLFKLVADNKELCNHRKLGMLLYEMIMIPKQLGEVAAFGGSNIEPSVRSCFEYAKSTTEISLTNFLEWLKLEPQSVVWLPVLHRLAAAETARHDAKCSICKEYPIVGFRYRSLKHFNFDICQNCFFSGRKIKGFKFDHPLLEYYTPTSSSDDIKDFFRIFRNKFRSKRARRSSKLGYLPVQSVLEGDEFETPKAALDLELTKELESKFEPIKQQQQQLQLQKELEQQILEKKRQQQQRQIELQVLQQQQQQQQIQQNETILQSPKLSYTSPTPTAQQQQLISSLNRTSISEKPYSSVLFKSADLSSTYTKLADSDEEHLLIAKICSSLNIESERSKSSQRELQQQQQQQQQQAIMASKYRAKLQQDREQAATISQERDEQQKELESIIKDLEEENSFLMEEYTRLQSQLGTNRSSTSVAAATTSAYYPSDVYNSRKANTLHYGGTDHYQTYNRMKQSTQRRYMMDYGSGSVGYHSVRALSSSPTPTQNSQRNYVGSAFYAPPQTSQPNGSAGRIPFLFKSTIQTPATVSLASGVNSKESEMMMLKEARMLREHEDKLEARMKILENHNRLLDSQLKQLKALLNNSNQQLKENGTNGRSKLTSPRLDIQQQLQQPPILNNGSSNISATTTFSYSNKKNIGNLFNNVEDITRAINNLNNLVNAMGTGDPNSHQ